MREGEHFRALFHGCSVRWEVAGSIRRRRADVGDIEHVVIAAHGVPVVAPEDSSSALFTPLAGPGVNLLWRRCDELLAMGVLSKAIYSDGKARWGQVMRGILLAGVRHEVWTCAAETWGSCLAIRTGPEELCERLMGQLKANGRYVHDHGAVRYAGGASAGEIRATPAEREFFELCGMVWCEPEGRG